MSGFGISNIAWPSEHDDAALELAAEAGFTGIELAPMKVFGPLSLCPADRMSSYRRAVERRGLTITSLQAILFGVTGCELFASLETRERLADHLRLVARTAGELGARACVFGAPTLRDPGSLPAPEAWAIAVEFFAAIAEHFEAADAQLCFEANPTHYNCRFVTTTTEAAALVRAVGRRGLRLQIDTGTIFINDEDPSFVAEICDLAGHFHASERDLAPVGQSGSDHRAVALALARGGYAAWRTVEMRTATAWSENMRAAARFMTATYGGLGAVNAP